MKCRKFTALFLLSSSSFFLILLSCKSTSFLLTYQCSLLRSYNPLVRLSIALNRDDSNFALLLFRSAKGEDGRLKKFKGNAWEIGTPFGKKVPRWKVNVSWLWHPHRVWSLRLTLSWTTHENGWCQDLVTHERETLDPTVRRGGKETSASGLKHRSRRDARFTFWIHHHLDIAYDVTKAYHQLILRLEAPSYVQCSSTIISTSLSTYPTTWRSRRPHLRSAEPKATLPNHVCSQ